VLVLQLVAGLGCRASFGDRSFFRRILLGERRRRPGGVARVEEPGRLGQRGDELQVEQRLAGVLEPGGRAIDRLFLQLMITHHEGAVTMVEGLLE